MNNADSTSPSVFLGTGAYFASRALISSSTRLLTMWRTTTTALATRAIATMSPPQTLRAVTRALLDFGAAAWLVAAGLALLRPDEQKVAGTGRPDGDMHRLLTIVYPAGAEGVVGTTTGTVGTTTGGYIGVMGDVGDDGLGRFAFEYGQMLHGADMAGHCTPFVAHSLAVAGEETPPQVEVQVTPRVWTPEPQVLLQVPNAPAVQEYERQHGRDLHCSTVVGQPPQAWSLLAGARVGNICMHTPTRRVTPDSPHVADEQTPWYEYSHWNFGQNG